MDATDFGKFSANIASCWARMESAMARKSGADPTGIPRDMTFVEWVEGLGRHGLEVDGHPFTLADRPALRAIYTAIPTTKEEGYNRSLAIMKGAQTGLTVLTFLLQLYFALKHTPLKVGVYYPDRSLASYVSSSRFMPVLRTVPLAYRALLEANDGKEGNVLTRQLGKSEVLFLWTSGSSFTESFPLGVVIADEVQGMLVDDIERIKERMSASDVRFFFACSTAKWPGADIDFLYKQGDQRQFHTECGCGDGVVLDECFPDCIKYNDGKFVGAPLDFIYACPVCGRYIPDPQVGRWVAHNPGSTNTSYHFPQILSPTVSPREIIEAFTNAQDMQNFWNRKLGKPWVDPSQVPVTLAHLEACAAAGALAGVAWKAKARNTVMGIDQMGAFNCVVIKERLRDGRQAVIHVESIYDSDPFARCDVLMTQYGVDVCVLETLPNYNDAKRFAQRHRGRVFLAGYADINDEMMRWGDAQPTKAERKTSEAERDRYTVTLDQFKCMSVSMARITGTTCLFSDPNGLAQDIRVKGQTKRVAILREEVWLHFTKTALVVEKDEEQKKFRRKVVKVAIDPHYSYANMLCDVAWARNHGTSTFVMPEERAMTTQAEKLKDSAPGLPGHVLRLVNDAPEGTCGRCSSFDGGACRARGFRVGARDPACVVFVPV
ncbi:MAG: hypothetical protein GC191_09000 [Azospirillum sp.]|nr:hypothetical protein [Azospirillum sp.]